MSTGWTTGADTKHSDLRDLHIATSTADVLRQHRDALEELRTAFNALDAKQRQQAHALIALAAENEAHITAIAGLRGQSLIFARTLGGRLRWLLVGE